MSWLSKLLNVPCVGFIIPCADGKVNLNSAASIAVFILCHVLCFVIAYLLGSLNFGIIISKFKFHDDIRNHGSKNAGMSNMLRTYGIVAAIMTFVGDALKSFISVLLGLLLLGEMGPYLAGLGVILGHVYPVFFKFKGGKGVVTAITTILFTDPIVGLVIIAIFVLVVAVTRYISLGSILGAAFYPLLVYTTSNGIRVIYAFCISVFVIWLHRKNIMRLKDGTENKIGKKGTKK